MFLPTETNPFPENAEFTYTHDGWGVSSLNENALQKHKTAGHRGDYRAGLHSQDDVTRDGAWGILRGQRWAQVQQSLVLNLKVQGEVIGAGEEVKNTHPGQRILSTLLREQLIISC